MKLQFKSISYFLSFMFFCALIFTACDEDSGKDKDNTPTIENETYTVDGISFNMVRVPDGVTTPIGLNDDGDIDGDMGETSRADVDDQQTISDAYFIADTEVTYQLWYEVYIWATDTARESSQYTFTFDQRPHAGNDGTPDTETDSQEPVTRITWRHAMVWCNALTEWYNANNGTAQDLDCVYFADSGYATPIRSASNNGSVNINPGQEDNPYVDPDANGFRLLTSTEWECAARYQDGTSWTNGQYASGATVGYLGEPGAFRVASSLVAVFNENWTNASTHTDVTTTAAVKSKIPNALGLYDMSGNVREWCFDWYDDQENNLRVLRGGAWSDTSFGLRVGFQSNIVPWARVDYIGFRFGRTE